MDGTGLVDLTTSFIQDVALPLDDAHDGDIEAAGGEAARLMLQAGARAEESSLRTDRLTAAGLGLCMVERAPVFEEAGYSLFGPLAFNIARPRRRKHPPARPGGAGGPARTLPSATVSRRDPFGLRHDGAGAGRRR